MKLLNEVLGINERNLELIHQHNHYEHYPLADNKLYGKKILQAANFPTPKLLKSYEYFFELRRIKEDLWNRADFVIKPARGMQGGGILIFDRFKNGSWLTTSNKIYSASDLFDHAAEILYGVYALDNTTDIVLVEERIVLDDLFAKITYRGIPDIRVLVFKHRVIMAMLRIPTSHSDGRANLHTGGIGVGIDLRSGVTTYAKFKKQIVDVHPDTGIKLSGIRIPNWSRILELSTRVQYHVPLGYIGIDFVLDKRYGPQILELNVRPGLEIQNVNRQGIKSVLKLR
ncbi:MAG: alpha-L-glutamate ligase-like protein [Aliifodinibius sp.]|nr:alpha-L-glutamate ligase-like protein [candidate division KSB1 bacterium]NIT61778.1 alpha-L-glutamate ligase-like protein [Fodinibius sp.]NIV16384.1 alpha-L-glutamate ligase-like protein [Fodinibius sp.]NIY30358.1 alpha-L-glutamate ligase-like protein [Fodinibius sp.]